MDSCFSTHTSDTATTLRIGIKVKSNNRADIIWSGFDISNISFDNFRLEKIIGSDTTFVGNFNRSETTFLETALFDYGADSLSAVCYRVTAFFENNNDVAPRETLASHSNIVCVQPEPKAFVPQAIAGNASHARRNRPRVCSPTGNLGSAVSGFDWGTD